MTKKTETKQAETVVENKATGEAIEKVTGKVAETGKAVSGLFSALTTGTRTALEGVIAVDKTLLGYVGEAAKSYAKLGRQSFQASSMSELFDLHVAHAHDRIEQNAANTREVLDLAQTKAKEAYAPIQEVVSAYLPEKKTAA
ncbi:phasin family protein [Paracoccus fistulariae]|uniref:Phasin family protein n=2 Tax=Paracoccus fistulariae TaxID=658446 RepID=A0ABY7SFV1_9RHOB|nr:phasin family protein [Paracoccus fistulariae]WCR05900.1 phasin family protein [Paracoccus fistulariae]